MNTPTMRWRVSPAAWVPISLAIVAESVSNGLRAYALGAHLERFTITVGAHPVSVAGLVLVLAAVAVSLSQARAAWVALTPSGPARQRIVAGIGAVLLLSISITAMASHILEAQRAKISDESSARGRYDRAKAVHDKKAAELAALGTPRPVAVIQAEVQRTRIDMGVWNRSKQCSDISRAETKAACQPILDLYKERGAAASKAELEPDVERLRQELAELGPRPEQDTASEGVVAGLWAWIMGLGVVLVATFGTVIFASVEAVRPTTANDNAMPGPKPGASVPVTEADHLTGVVTVLRRADRPVSNQELARMLGVSESTATRRTEDAIAAGLVTKVRDGRQMAISLAAAA